MGMAEEHERLVKAFPVWVKGEIPEAKNIGEMMAILVARDTTVVPELTLSADLDFHAALRALPHAIDFERLKRGPHTGGPQT